MDVAYVLLVHCDSWRCKFKDFCIISSYERKVPRGTYNRVVTASPWEKSS